MQNFKSVRVRSEDFLRSLTPSHPVLLLKEGSHLLGSHVFLLPRDVYICKCSFLPFSHKGHIHAVWYLLYLTVFLPHISISISSLLVDSFFFLKLGGILFALYLSSYFPIYQPSSL